MVSHELISPTAKIVADMRARTCIPYSAQIAELCNARAVAREILGEDYELMQILGPLIEIRFLSLSVLMERYNNYPQVLELAAGVAPRGLIASTNKGRTYIETDLPEMHHEKKCIIHTMFGDYFQQPNLVLQQLNVTDPSHYHMLKPLLSADSLTVLNEGLLQYLSHDEKASVARSVYKLLMHRRGVWITPDITTLEYYRKERIDDPRIKQIMERFTGLVGKGFLENSFKDNDEASAFFQSHGFIVSRVPMIDLVPLSMLTLPASDKKIKQRIEQSCVWVMKPV